MTKSNTQIAKAPKELTQEELDAKVALSGDLSDLTPKQQMNYYARYCAHLGLDPITRPFDLLTTFDDAGKPKTTLYANASCSAQLADKRSVTYSKPVREYDQQLGVLTVDVQAMLTTPDGKTRSCWRSGVAHIDGLKGKRLENAIKKAETQAHRRATLALCGVAMPDESEIEDIPGAQTLPLQVITAMPTSEEIFDTPRPLPDTPLPEAWTADTPAREIADLEIANKIGAELGKIAEEIKAEAPKLAKPAPQDTKNMAYQEREAPKDPDPVPALKSNLTAAQQKVSDAGVSLCKEHGKDKALLWHLINQFLGRTIKRLADLTDDEAARVFTYLQTLGSQWSDELQADNKVRKYTGANPAHDRALCDEMDALSQKLSLLGQSMQDFSHDIQAFAEINFGRTIQSRHELDDDEARAVIEFLRGQVAAMQTEKDALIAADV